ncbi:hypothetical protein JCM8547_006794 [Rhodosporidiobolus lusitaniae]
MATLSSTRSQLAAVAHTKRLFYGASAVGLVSLTAGCASTLPWDILDTQGRVVAFAIQALASFVWLTLPFVAIGSLQIQRRVRSAWWMLIVFDAAESATMAYLAVTLIQDKQRYVDACTSKGSTEDACNLRIGSLSIANPAIGAFLPIVGAFLLVALWRSFPFLPQSVIYDHLMDDDVPPGWHTPPAELAPDSSASDSEDDMMGDRAAAKGWYALGKKRQAGESTRSLKGGHRTTMSWSEVQRKRKEKKVSRSGLSA